MIYFYALKIQLFVVMMTTILSLLMVTTILSFLVKKWIWSNKSSMANLQIDFRALNPFMHNIVKRPNILSKSCGVNTARFLKYVWPFYNIMPERVKVRFFDKLLVLNTKKCHFMSLEIGNNLYMWWYNY